MLHQSSEQRISDRLAKEAEESLLQKHVRKRSLGCGDQLLKHLTQAEIEIRVRTHDHTWMRMKIKRRIKGRQDKLMLWWS